MRKGIPVSPGVAVGTAYCIHEIYVDPEAKSLEPQDIAGELAQFEAAHSRAAADLKAVRHKVDSQVGRSEGAIFGVHETILRDPAFTEKIRHWISQERMTVRAALHRLLNEYTSLFARTKDEYLRDRLNDVRDVVLRISSHLADAQHPPGKGKHPLSGPVIIVADELLPSQVVALGNVEVKGIVTQAGSQTSHAAIIARSRGIPAVSGIRGILRQVSTGDTIVVDGRDGHVTVNPDAETRSAYRKLEREYFHHKDELAANRNQPAVTADGVALQLHANINSVADARAAEAMGAAGVGLFRTEYIYLTHPDIPDEEEQFQIYREIVSESPQHQVTIRTLDIGGDKTVPYLGHHHKESNPFMGWRSIRLSFEHQELFTAQLRAILRAAAHAAQLNGSVRVMFPMITALEEINRVRQIVRRAERQLALQKKAYSHVSLGMMLEVPAAAICIDSLLHAVDFVSIGSNDLVQYLMAADRDNPKVSHLCQPLAPPVLRVLSNVVQACRAADKPLTLCGEMAGQPTSFVLLIGMGLRSFSMSPAFIPSMKDLARHITTHQAREILHHALGLKTTARVKLFMRQQLRRIAPSLTTWDPT